MSEQHSADGKPGRGLKIFGIVTIILGVLAMCCPFVTGMSIALLVGVLVTLAGLARLFWAFKAESLGSGILMFALGGLTLVCGIAMLARPMYAAGVLTLILTFYLVTDGVSEIFAAFHVRPLPGWGWLLFGGMFSVLLGLMIWSQYPLSGPMAVGIFIGLKLLFTGVIMLTVGSVVRSAMSGGATATS